jgi:hypothetical protein
MTHAARTICSCAVQDLVSSGGLCPLHSRIRGALALDSVEYYQLYETIQCLKRSKALAKTGLIKPSFPTRWSHGTRLVVGSQSCAQDSRDIHETGCTRTAEVTLFLTLPPAEKVHKINEITAWLPGRREQAKAEGGKSFRESSIHTTSSQSPERGTGLRRTCRINGLGGEWERQGFLGSRLARRAVAQPSMLVCLARLTARASAGTSLVMQEPAPI